mgnify:CR=1 FL=1
MNSRDTNTIRRRPLCLIGIFAAFLAGPQLQLATASFVATTFFGSRQKTIPSILYSHYETKKEPLIPEDNPEADPNIESKAGVRYGTVLSGLNRLFSPEELEKRNAISRSDGYWPYINDEDGPPLGKIY